jgi:hypothetical protein
MQKTIFCLLFSVSILASENQFKITGKYYSFIKKENLLLSSHCKNKCIALEKVKTITSKIIPKRKKFASSIGSYACTEVLKGQALLGIMKNKDMVAVCLFKQDSSMVDINSLTLFIENL